MLKITGINSGGTATSRATTVNTRHQPHMNLLFICSRNQWRSPTAEAIFRNHPVHEARSAGTEPSARIRISAKLLVWADLVFVMEKRHKQRLTERFPDEMAGKTTIILDIPDEYGFMDEELITSIEAAVAPYL